MKRTIEGVAIQTVPRPHAGGSTLDVVDVRTGHDLGNVSRLRDYLPWTAEPRSTRYEYKWQHETVEDALAELVRVHLEYMFEAARTAHWPIHGYAPELSRQQWGLMRLNPLNSPL